MNDGRLTHVDETGAARMVDVSAKDVTVRTARATGRVRLSGAAVAALRGGGVPKGDAIAVARIAGIAGSKRTPDLIPLCHPIALHGVTVDLAIEDWGVSIVATARTADRTGVEMEALTAVSVAALALVDMVKAIDPAAVISDIRVEEKTGGKSGPWRRPVEALRRMTADSAWGTTCAALDSARVGGGRVPSFVAVAAVRADLVVAGGSRERPRGDLAQRYQGARRLGVEPGRGRRVRGSQRALARVTAASAGCASVDGPVVVPDGEPVEAALHQAVAEGYDVVVTTGGTGLTPTDLTPEMTRRVLDTEIPGIAEAIRRAGADAVPAAILSRGVAGLAGRTLLVNLPGSAGGVRDGMAVLAPVLAHAVDQIRGGDHPRPA